MTLPYHLGSIRKTLFHFLTSQSCLMKEIPTSPTYFLVDNTPLIRQIMVHARINHLQHKTMLTAKKIYPGSSIEEIQGLLPSDITGRHTDSFFFNAMVGCKNDILRMP